MPALRKIYFLPFITLMLGIGALTSYQLPDDNILRQILSKFNKFNERYLQHKIYLHINKPFYVTGETIWFKAYQVNGSNHEPYAMSKVVYAELINAEQKIVFKEKLEVEQGFAYGDFLLPDSLPSGVYMIRAYNNWMRNFDPGFFFYKQIQIFNTSQPIATESPGVTSQQVDLQFFPEGGNLVNSLSSKVAFKAINTNGEGTDIEGVITDEAGDTIVPFKSSHLGMGAFDLQPEAGKQYTATITLADSSLAKYLLPKALDNGFLMGIDNTSEETIKVRILSSMPSQPSEMILIAQMRGQVYFSAQLNSLSESEIEIPKKDFPSGIVHITLLDSKGTPHCERLAFVNHENNLQIHVRTDKNTYSPREKVNMQIEVSDKQGKPVSAHLSIAISDAHSGSKYEQYTDNILSYLLLTSDLKGNIEQPGFYFLKNNPKSKEALDYLMLTHGWRRFIWKEVISSTYPAIQYETEDGITLAGKLVQTPSKTPVPNQFIALATAGWKPAFQHQYTDEEGNFYFSGLHYTNNKQLLLHVPSLGVQATRNIELDTVVPVQEINFRKQSDIHTIWSYLEKSKMRKEIEAAYTSATDASNTVVADTLGQVQISETKSAYTITDVPADHSIDLDKYNEFPDMTEVLREIVPGILIKSKKGVNSLRILDIKRKLYFKQEPVYFIDGMPVYDANYIFKLDPGMVKKIEIYGRPEKLARFDLLGKNGVMAVFTRTGDLYPDNTQHSFIIPFSGYYQAREFYAPAYEQSTDGNEIPDFRPVLYWNPKVSTDMSGKATISFYAPDDIASYTATIEGISDRGIFGVAEHQFQVKMPLQSKK